MNRRPWPVIVLAILQLFAPIVGLLITAALEGVEPLRFTKSFIYAKSWWELFDYFALLPIAGISIYLMKKWSYPVFLVVMIWTIYQNTKIWFSYYQQTMSIWIFVGIMFLNILAVTYYLLPAVRSIYFNNRIRWWESKPRFKVEIPGVIDYKNLTHPCLIRDISIGGAFIESPQPIQAGEMVCIQVSVLNKRFPVYGKVVHQRSPKEGTYGIGLQFEKKKSEDLKIIRNMVRALELLGCDLTGYKETAWESFRGWMSDLKSGKGFVPNIPKR